MKTKNLLFIILIGTAGNFIYTINLPFIHRIQRLYRPILRFKPISIAVRALNKYKLAASVCLAASSLLAFSKTRRMLIPKKIRAYSPYIQKIFLRTWLKLKRLAGFNANSLDNHGRSSLQRAIEQGDGDLTRKLLSAGVNINILDDQHRNPLYFAIINGTRELVQALIAAGAYINQSFWRITPLNLPHGKRITPLHLAVEHGNQEIIQDLIAAGALIDYPGVLQKTALHLAAENGQTDIVRILIAAGATVNIKSQRATTPLCLAAQNGHADTVRALIAAGADIHHQDISGQSPLLQAACNGHHEVMRILLEAGAHVNEPNYKFESPLHSAVRGGHLAAVQTLLAAGANIDIIDKHKQKPLSIAARLRHEDIMRTLIQAGAHIEPKQLRGNRLIEHFARLTDPLCQAVSQADTPRVQELMARGASAVSLSSAGNTAIHAAIGTYKKEEATPLDTIAYMLIKTVGARATRTRNAAGQTPLHIAAMHGNTRLMRLLLLHGAEVHAQDNDGNTPLHMVNSVPARDLLFVTHNAYATVRNHAGKTPIDLQVKVWQYGFGHLAANKNV